MEEQKEMIKESSHREVVSIIFLILLLCAIGALISATITVYKYKDMLANPIGYNMDRFGLNQCSCLDSYGKTVLISAIASSNNFSNVPTRSN